MRDIFALFLHVIVTVIRLARPGGLRSVVAESVLVRHQLLILNRGRKRAPNLRVADRFIAGVCTLFICRARLLRSASVQRPSTLLLLHRVLIKRQYRLLSPPTRRRRPGPKGPAQELIDAVVEMKRRNPRWGCPRIAQQIALAFGIEIDKDVVRRILSVHYRPKSNGGGPSWLTFLGHAKDSLWSCDLFRCESAAWRTHWVLVVMEVRYIEKEQLGWQAGSPRCVGALRRRLRSGGRSSGDLAERSDRFPGRTSLVASCPNRPFVAIHPTRRDVR